MNSITKAAISAAGGASVVAKACELTRQAVCKWESIPPKHVLTVERLSGVSRHELRPDIYGRSPGPLARKADPVAA